MLHCVAHSTFIAELGEGAAISKEHNSYEGAASSSSSSGKTSDDDNEFAGEDEIKHSYTGDNEANLSLGEVRMGPKFKKLVQDPILVLTVSPEVKGSPFDAMLYDKCKGKLAVEGPSKRHKKKGK
ncbi:hypothetical protein Acr_16g0000610 [Actinidia rufa]|uniref:Uncharacterized protein n=1 Tax=Actinidia rufa TaxID=165716 RepID=A0A7J0FY91_9ERIC|nr:hypothetical protein Acr_16g0000610 [Actinidia rufa]